MEVKITTKDKLEAAYKKVFEDAYRQHLEPSRVERNVRSWLNEVETKLIRHFLGLTSWSFGIRFERDSPYLEPIRRLYQKAIDAVLGSYEVELTQKEEASLKKLYRRAFLHAMQDAIESRGREDGRDYVAEMTLTFSFEEDKPKAKENK